MMIRDARGHIDHQTGRDKNERGRVGVITWQAGDGIATVIADELRSLGYTPIPYHVDGPLPRAIRFLFSFGPYGQFLRAPRQLAQLTPGERPLFIHWNTEGIPDLRMPPTLVRAIAKLCTSLNQRFGVSDEAPLLRRMARFRNVGDYYDAYGSGWLGVFADSSAIYSRWHQAQGLPALYAPWGATPRWHRDLELERDVDVLWMGNRNSRRRDGLLTMLHRELQARSVNVHLADNISNPFIFDAQRTSFLNRSKITLNLLRTWYDDNYSRFALAASNRSLLVSEPLLPHCPDCVAGVHYVSAPPEKLADTIVHYLRDDAAREQIVDNAFQLVTGRLKFNNSIGHIMASAETLLRTKRVA